MSRVKQIENELTEFINLISESSQLASVSYLVKGRWHKIEVKLQAVTDANIQLILVPDESQSEVPIEIDQPVGITVIGEQCKYLAETVVIGVDSNIIDNKPGLILVKKPCLVEKMQRRAYLRVDVPNDMVIKVLFWHRGYSDNASLVPLENYWEGVIVDLSAGGLQMTVRQDLADNFRQGQFVGIQFTPLPYQRPVIIEGIIRHIVHTEDAQISLGVKFIGLETSTQGRKVIKQLSEAIEKYE